MAVKIGGQLLQFWMFVYSDIELHRCIAKQFQLPLMSLCTGHRMNALPFQAALFQFFNPISRCLCFPFYQFIPFYEGFPVVFLSQVSIVLHFISLLFWTLEPCISSPYIEFEVQWHLCVYVEMSILTFDNGLKSLFICQVLLL